MKDYKTKNCKTAAIVMALLLATSSLAHAGPPDNAPPPENMGTQQMAAGIGAATGAPLPQLPFCVLHPLQAANNFAMAHPDAAQACMDIASGALDLSGAGPVAP